jgi:alpha-glucosidase
VTESAISSASSGAESAAANAGSPPHLYQRLIAERSCGEALRRGHWEELGTSPDVLAYTRRCGDERVTVVNFADRAVDVALDGRWRVLVASDREGEGEPYSGTVHPEQALLLRPEGN